MVLLFAMGTKKDKRLQLRLPKDLHDRLMALDIDGGVSLLVRELLAKEVERLEEKKRAKSLRVRTR